MCDPRRFRIFVHRDYPIQKLLVGDGKPLALAPGFIYKQPLVESISRKLWFCGIAGNESSP